MTAWHPEGFPWFDQPVAEDGYQWWYVDGISDDDRYGVTLIAFVGSVFSPYYAWARGRGEGDPAHHCALNVALYGPKGRWALTERGRGQLERDREGMAVGPSRVRWTGECLEFSIDEWAVPIPRRVRGTVRVYPESIVTRDVVLDSGGLHRWWPVAPHARVEVEMISPDLRWSGPGYWDGNRGEAPLESAFTGWNWSRAHLPGGTGLLYEVVERDGRSTCHAFRAAHGGELEALAPPGPVGLPPGMIWRVPRATRSEGPASIVRTLEDTPFYTRSVMRSTLDGHAVEGMHESLDLDRFASRWVQLLLPFRMPRIAR
ncbi:MAG: carotenoid 1,2-hydratase [Pseudomonadota bacterium]